MQASGGKTSNFFFCRGEGYLEIINTMLQTLLLTIHSPFLLTKGVPVLFGGRALYFSASLAARDDCP